MVKLWFAKVRPDGIIPSKRDEDAGYDIFLAFDGEYIRLEPHETKLLPTGIASALSTWIHTFKRRALQILVSMNSHR